MPIIQTPSKSIDRKSQTFTQTGAGGGSFSSAVVNAVQENPTAVPQSAAGVEYSEIAEIAQQQDDTLFCRLINNNVNCRYTNTNGSTQPAVVGMLQVPTLVPFDTESFNGGGMEQIADTTFFTSNKCGVYRVSFGMLFDITEGLDTEDFGVYLLLKTPSGGNPANPYLSVLWQGVGIVNKFWANGSDLIELEVGESVGIGMRNGAIAGISAGNYTLSAWIAINYTGNQH